MSEKVKLVDICNVLNGYAFKSNKYVGMGIRIVRIANVQKGYIEDSTPVFYPCDDNEVKKYMLEENDILMSLTGNVGRVAKISREFLPAALNQRVACLRIKDEAVWDKDFIFNLLNSDYFEQQCILASKGVAQKNLSTEWIKKYEIPIIPLEKQKEITNTLDKISELISLRRQQIEKLDELVKARFVELIHGNSLRYVKLKDAVEEGRIITYGIVKPGEHTEGGIPIIKVKDFPNGTILMNDMLLASPEIESKYERSRVKEGDLLFSIRGSVGRTAFVPKELINANITQDTARISVGTDFNSHYIRAALGYDSVQQEINEHVRGVAVRGISLAELREIEIPVVKKKTQDEFGRFVEQTDKSKLTIQQSLDKLEVLKKSLMQKYFG